MIRVIFAKGYLTASRNPAIGKGTRLATRVTVLPSSDYWFSNRTIVAIVGTKVRFEVGLCRLDWRLKMETRKEIETRNTVN